MEDLETACGIRHFVVSVSRPGGTTCQCQEIFSCLARLSSPQPCHTDAFSFYLRFPERPVSLSYSLHKCIFLYTNDPIFSTGTMPYFVTYFFLGQLTHWTSFTHVLGVTFFNSNIES